MEKEKGQEDQKIRVTDRRAFDATGRRKPHSPDIPARGNGEKKTSDTSESRTQAVPTDSLAPLDFDFFIQNLYVAVLVNLGEVEDPISKQTSTNLEAARQTIDLLGILEEKTKGNLDSGEKDHLEGVLYDLRMRYTKKVKAS